MSTFGQPVYTEADATQSTTANGANGAALEQPQELLDLNDPRLTSEALDVNTEGDAYAQPAPPPDGKYRAKLKLEKQKVKDATGAENEVDYIAKMYGSKQPQACLSTVISAHIVDPSGKYDGIQVWDRWVSTFVGRDGSTKIATILARLKQPNGAPYIEQRPGTAPDAIVKAGRKLSPKEWVELLVKALAGEPEVGIETQWEWSCQKCGEVADSKHEKRPRSITGMNKFPMSKDRTHSTHDPEMQCAVDRAHGFSRARLSIARFMSLAELGQR